MKRFEGVVLASVVLAIGAAGCSPKADDAPETRAAEAPPLTPAHVSLGPKNLLLKTCDELLAPRNGELGTPTRVIVYSFDKFRAENLGTLPVEMPANKGGTDVDPVGKGKDPHWKGANPKKTIWDVDLKLEAPTAKNPKTGKDIYVPVLIKIIEEKNKKIELRRDEYTIAAGEELGVSMFCDLDPRAGIDYATFKVIYFDDGGDPGTAASFNIGVYVRHIGPEPGGGPGPTTGISIYSTPIFIDPNIRNNG